MQATQNISRNVGRKMEKTVADILPALHYGLMKDSCLFRFIRDNVGALQEGDSKSLNMLARLFRESPRHVPANDRLNNCEEETICAAIALDVTYAYLAGLLPVEEWDSILSVVHRLVGPISLSAVRKSACGRSVGITELTCGIGKCMEVRTDNALLRHAVMLLSTWQEEACRRGVQS